MIRRACYALLLTCCTAAFAEPLYKWTEADGTITFSPEKPPSGVDFQVIESISGITATQADRTIEPALAAGISSTSASATDNITEKSERAPQSIASLYPANSESGSSSVSWSANVEQPAAPTRAAQISRISASSAGTTNRCEDLRKRVVSLERRLKAQLTPEDMDNTVVHMSRYQRSYDKFCVQ